MGKTCNCVLGVENLNVQCLIEALYLANCDIIKKMYLLISYTQYVHTSWIFSLGTPC